MKRRKISSTKTAFYVFAIPGLCFFAFAVLIPLIMGINISFTDWNGISTDYNYVGFDNFITVFTDKRIRQPILNSLLFAVLGCAGNNILALSLALFVNQKIGKLGNVARVVFFIPVCFSQILTAFLWKFIYREVITQIFDINNPLGTTTWVIPAIVVMGLWNTVGINMLIYLSGLKNVPVDLYEAATVDGATGWQRFRKITLPMLMPSFNVCVTLTLTSWLREFGMTLSATQGGPGGASRTISIYIFENLYKFNKAGYGQAVSMLFVVFLVLIGTSVSSFFRKREVEL